MADDADTPLWRTSETWPYSDSDLKRIARSLGRSTLSDESIDVLTDAAMAYCLGAIADRNHGVKQRRGQFERIAVLSSRLAKRLRQLNAMSAQQVRTINPNDLELLAISAEGAVRALRGRVEDPQEMLLDFVGELYDVFATETGEAPTRSKRGKKAKSKKRSVRTQFERFVDAALKPINPSATQDIHRDIKLAIKQRRAAM
jgi:hypothetical protein